MQYKITKIEKYGKGRYESEKIGIQWYNIVHCRVWTNKEHTRFWRIKFISMFDAYDLWEYTQNDSPSQKDINEFKWEVAQNEAESLIGCSKDIEEVVQNCNDNIKRRK